MQFERSVQALQHELRSLHQLTLTDPDLSQVALSDLRGALSAPNSRSASSTTPLMGLFPGDLSLPSITPSVKTDTEFSSAAAPAANAPAAAASKASKDESSAAIEHPAQSGEESNKNTPQVQPDSELTATIKVECSPQPVLPDSTEVCWIFTIHAHVQ